MNIKPPFVYDSLDKENSTTGYKKENRKDNTATIVAIVIGTVALLASLLFLYVMSDLRALATDYDSTATFLLWLLRVCVVGSLSAGILFATAFGLLWLRNWYLKKGLISILEGPHYRARDVKFDYEKRIDELMQQRLAIMLEEANKSIYRSATTLTLDQSTSTTSTTNDTKVDATNNSSSDTDGLDLLLLDKLNKG